MVSMRNTTIDLKALPMMENRKKIWLKIKVLNSIPQNTTYLKFFKSSLRKGNNSFIKLSDLSAEL